MRLLRIALSGVALAPCAVGLAAQVAHAEGSSCVQGSHAIQICVNKVAPSKAESLKATASSRAGLRLTLPWPNTEVKCTATTSKTSAFSDTPKVNLEFSSTVAVSGCEFAGKGEVAELCTIEPSYTLQSSSGKFTSASNYSMQPAGGPVLWGFTVISRPGKTCPSAFKGVQEATGSYECAVSAASEELVEHEMSCSSNASHEVHLHNYPLTKLTLTYADSVSLTGVNSGKPYSIFQASS
jgi:hypothetical protein